MFRKFKNLLKKERGIETIEVVIILVIIVALGFAFRNLLFDWYNYLVGGLESQIFSNSPTPPYGS